ncbi:hypothetical protein BXP70_28520 [Hymenobacter crusticola]|uniref:Secretion system C-terminal sorting domain-containing protein n=2 Tax=Hymenobacter crusticola TaxID=1770526 RepID=A0A243W504_9BACT|nr:hypothetical protein BXP70_28520 [Hymenobacter crusticola]
MAQTTPTWKTTYAIGIGSSYTLVAAVDASGNTYEAGSFDGTTSIGNVSLTSKGGMDGYLAKYRPDGSVAWVRQLGSSTRDLALDVTVDATGNAYVTGCFSGTIALGNSLLLTSNTSSLKGFVIRYSPQGEPEWVQQSIARAGNSVLNSGIGIDAMGHVYVTGYCDHAVTFGTSTVTYPDNGTFLARFSAVSGAVEFLKPAFAYDPLLATPLVAYYYNPQLAVAPSGEICVLNVFSQPAVLGATTLISRGDDDVLLAKYDAHGTFQWVQQFGGPATERMTKGGLDAAGNLYVVGSFQGAALFGNTTVASNGDDDGCLVKYSAQGAFQWVQPVGGSGADRLTSVSLDAGGNPYVSGDFKGVAQMGTATLTSAGSSDVLVAAYTPEGQVRWVQQAGGAGYDAGSCLGLSAQGDIHVLGRFMNNCAFGPLTLATTANRQETFLATLGTNVLAAQATRSTKISLYPNPATSQVHLSGLTTSSPVQLLDAVGQIVRTYTFSTEAALSLNGIAPGLYTLRATDAQGRTYTSRLLVQ